MDLSSLAHRRPASEMRTVKSLANYNMAQRPIPSYESLKDITTLDQSQLLGINRIVATELGIVQGPPGTGKTFTSIEAIKVLVATRRIGLGKPPIIVAAQTNHALDQLLTLCMDADARIVRLGSRMESEKIAERTLFNIQQNSRSPRASAEAEYTKLKNELRNNVRDVRQLVDTVFGQSDDLLSPEVLFENGIITKEQHASLATSPFTSDATTEDDMTTDAMRLWLGENLIPAELLRSRHVEQAAMDENDAIKFRYEHEYEEDVEKDPPGMRNWLKTVRRELNMNDDLFDIDPHLRGGVYQLLQSKMLAVVTPKFRELLAKNIEICKRLKVNKWLRDLELVANEKIDIVGCTTTGLTKYRGFLAALEAKTLLIEEAAETREANIT
jgi:helicase required for RNAi-mediated heterochromatin assembly 1